MPVIDDAAEKFFNEGVSRYAQARATVVAFEQAAAAKVAQVARTRAQRLLAPNAKAKVIGNGVVNGDNGGRAAYAQFKGKFGAEDVTPGDGDVVGAPVRQ